jgi:hypothetical protein
VTIGDLGSDVLLERCPELGFRGAMYGMADVVWSSSSLSLSGSCLLLAESSRCTGGGYIGPG